MLNHITYALIFQASILKINTKTKKNKQNKLTLLHTT